MRVALSAALLLAFAPTAAWAQDPPPATADDAPAAGSADASELADSKVPLEEIRRYVAVYNAVIYIPLILIFIALWFLMIRPQTKRMK